MAKTTLATGDRRMLRVMADASAVEGVDEFDAQALRALADKIAPAAPAPDPAQAQREADDAAILGLLGEGWRPYPASVSDGLARYVNPPLEDRGEFVSIVRGDEFYRSLLAAARRDSERLAIADDLVRQLAEQRAEAERWQRRVVELERRNHAARRVLEGADVHHVEPAPEGELGRAVAAMRENLAEHAVDLFRGDEAGEGRED